MKRITTILFFGALVLMLSSMNFVDVNPGGKAGYTASPGELTCAKSGCHDTYALNSGTGSVTITSPNLTNWQYVPGQAYTINVTVSYTGRSLFGLGFEALRSTGANGGTLTAGTGTHILNATVSGNSRANITQTQGGGASANSHTFSFTWTAPSTNIGDVTFYCSGLCANSNGNEASDYVYTTSQVVSPLSAPNTPVITANGSTTACTGTTVPLSVTSVNGETYTWYNASNTQVGTGATFNASVTGCYHVTASNAGGTATSTETCVTISSPNAAFTTSATSVCVNAASISLTPSTSGGTFSGPGVSGTSFSPATAGAGMHTVQYSITDGNGCTSTSTQTITVSSLPSAVFSGVSANYCSGDAPVTLVPTTTGGSFSGDGVSGTTFNPSAAGAGVHAITYNITNGACSASTSQNVTVSVAPDASFSGLESIYCSEDPTVPLTPVTNGGTFSGNGIIGSTAFSANAAGAGTHEIAYSVTSGNCTATTTQTVTVYAPQNASFSGLGASYCSADAAVALTPATAGGTFSGPGISGNTFNPATANANSTITYTISSPGCTNSSSVSTTVGITPNASFTGLNPTYCTNSSTAVLTPAQSGGTFSGDGVIGSNAFSAVDAGEGVHIIEYTITNGSCSATSSQSVTVVATASSDFTGLETSYCSGDAVVSLQPSQAGGAFSGAGVSGNQFDPAAAGVGEHVITYSVDFGGCASTSTATTTVSASPDASFSGLADSYCVDAPNLNLEPTQNGGNFSGDGVIGTTFSPSAAGAGEHAVTYNISNGECAASVTVNTTVYALPDATFSGLNPTYCLSGLEVPLTATTVGGSFSGDGVFDNTFIPSMAGVGMHTIVYEVTNSNGCSSSSSQTTEVLASPNTTVTLNGGTLTAAQTGATYQWYNCDAPTEPINGATAVSYTPSVTGNYNVELTLNGCLGSSDCVFVTVISVDEQAKQTLVMYPNPATDEVTMNITESGDLMIYDQLGQIILKKNVAPGNRVINVSLLVPGVYTVVLHSGAHQAVSRLIKQ